MSLYRKCLHMHGLSIWSKMELVANMQLCEEFANKDDFVFSIQHCHAFSWSNMNYWQILIHQKIPGLNHKLFDTSSSYNCTIIVLLNFYFQLQLWIWTPQKVIHRYFWALLAWSNPCAASASNSVSVTLFLVGLPSRYTFSRTLRYCSGIVCLVWRLQNAAHRFYHENW